MGKKYLYRLLALALPLAAFLMLAAPAFAQAVTFQPQVNYPSPATLSNPADIVRGDFDRDGDPDLATANSGNVTIFQNDGSGNYSTAPTPLPSGAANPTSIDRGDFNGDKKPDLVVTDSGGNVYVLLNTNATPGVISFGAPIPTSTGGTNPTDVAVGDFNDDGDSDLAATNQGSNTIAILISNGTGNFALAQTVNLPAGTTQPTAADAADFDNDNDLDVVVANQGTNNATLLRNNGIGLFAIGQTKAVDQAPSDIIARDFNNDGNQDFATANAASDDISVALGNGNGTFKAAADFGAQTSPGSELAGADYNCDGNPDIAVTSPANNIVQVLTGNGDGTFNGALPFSVGTTPSGLTSDDFDNQNGPDLATSNFGSKNISVLLNASPNCGGSTNPNFTLTKDDSPDPVKVGNNLTYTLTLANTGPKVSDVTITDALPAGVTFVSASSGCTNLSNTVTCNVGSVSNGSPAQVGIVVQVNQAGTLINTASALGSSGQPLATASATTTAQSGNNNNNGGNHHNRNRRNNYNGGFFRHLFPNLFNDQYGNQYDNGQYGNNEGTGSTSTATGQYEGTSPGNGVSASAGPGGTSTNAGGTSADAGNPDNQYPVSSPQGDIVPTVDTGGEPLPPTGGISLWKLASLAGITLAPLVVFALIGSSRLWGRWRRRRSRE